MEELLFAPLFASNNEYRLLSLDCSSNENIDNNNHNNCNSKSLEEMIRNMQEKCLSTHKEVLTKEQSCEQKEKEEKELYNKQYDHTRENAADTSLVLVLRNGKQLVAHDDHCTHVVKRLEYSNNLLITLFDAKCDEHNEALTKWVDETEKMEYSDNTDKELVKEEDHQEQLHGKYKIVSQINSIYSCTRLSGLACDVVDGNSSDVHKRECTRWQCFVYNVLQHCLVTIEELESIMMKNNMTMCESEEECDNTVDYICADKTNTLEQKWLPSDLLLEHQSENSNSSSHRQDKDHDHYYETNDATEGQPAKRCKVDQSDDVISKISFLQSHHILEESRGVTHYMQKMEETKLDKYTFYELLQKVPCSPQELAHTLINMGAITCGVDHHIYLLQPAELYTAFHSTIKMFESILLREETWSVMSNSYADDIHSNSSSNSKSKENRCSNEAVWKSIMLELCPELYPEIVIRAIQSIYSASSNNEKKQHSINTTTITQKRQVEISASNENESLVAEELSFAPTTSHVIDVDSEDMYTANEYQRYSLYFSNCFDVGLTVIGLTGYLFYSSPAAQHKNLLNFDIEIISLHTHYFWRELLKIMPPWLQHAVVIMLMTKAANSSDYKSAISHSSFDVNVAHNAEKNKNEYVDSNNCEKLCAYILHILQEHVIVIRDMNTANSGSTNIYNEYSGKHYSEEIKEDELDNTGEENSSSKFSDMNIWYDVIWLPVYTLPTQMEQRVKALAQVKRSPWSLQELTTYLAPVLLSDDKMENVLARYAHESPITQMNSASATNARTHDKYYTLTC